MKTVLVNPFIPNPSVIRPRTERSAVAFSDPSGSDATAAPFSVSPDPPGENRYPLSQGRAVRTARVAHNHEVVGSNPTPATNSALASAMTADTDAAPDLTDPPVAAAVLIDEPSPNEGRPEEASAPAPTKNPDADALDCVHEIFFYARKLSAEARTFVPDYPGIYQAMLDPNAPRALETDPVWADDAPLFLQKREA